MVEQGLDVLWFQRTATHAPKAEGVELICDQGEHALTVALGGVAAVAVALAKLFQLVVQVAHGVLSLW